MNAAPRGSQRPSTAVAGAASRTSAASSTPAAAGTAAAASAPPASPSRLGRLATSAANVFTALTSPLRGGSVTVGASPFNGSDANSPLTTNTAAGLSTSGDGDVNNDADAIIQEAFEADFYERGDGGDSDEEGAEINAHNDSVAFLNQVEHQQRQEDNIEDEEEDLTDERTIPGAPDGWTPLLKE